MKNDGGFTYPALLALIVVMGIAITTASQSWTTLMTREKEATLLFRGDQIRRAIASYYNAPADKSKRTYPPSLKVLLKDPRFPGVKRHLRKIYPDPMTSDGKWGVILAGNGRIKGVFSQSDKEPMKKGNFSAANAHFKDKMHYSDWTFFFVPKKQKK